MDAVSAPLIVGRIACAVLGAACAWGAVDVVERTTLPAPAALVEWERSHPDYFALDAAQEAVFASKRAEKRHQDVLWLLVGLASGGLLTAVAPRRLVQTLGGLVSGVLVTGAVTTGAWALARSVDAQHQRAQHDGWTLGDDTLASFANAHTGTLRDLRVMIPDDHAIITIGQRDIELNLVSWALHPRAIYPIFTRPPMGTSIEMMAAELGKTDFASGHAGRWVLDLGRMGAFSSYVGEMVAQID